MSTLKNIYYNLTHYNKSDKRYPGLYALINNKKEEGYKVLFNKIKFILSLENQSQYV